MCFFPKSTSKCLGLALNASHGEIIPHHDGNAFFLKPPGLCQGQDTGLDRLWLWCGMAALLLSCQTSLQEASQWDKQVSLWNDFPAVKVIPHLDEVHNSLSVLQTCLFPTEYDIFSKLYKRAIPPVCREEYPEISAAVEQSETKTLQVGTFRFKVMLHPKAGHDSSCCCRPCVLGRC